MNYEINSPVIENNHKHKGILYVLPSSEDEFQSALEVYAEYFKKEFRYDQLQYCKTDDNRDCTGFLITKRAMDLTKDVNHNPYRIVGGGCFRNNRSGDFVLDWVWFHPFARNRGELKKHWPEFRKNFGNFTVTEPISSHMKSFLEKHA
jgi:hypothetical protein